jgi:hypothetical protein
VVHCRWYKNSHQKPQSSVQNSRAYNPINLITALSTPPSPTSITTLTLKIMPGITIWFCVSPLWSPDPHAQHDSHFLQYKCSFTTTVQPQYSGCNSCKCPGEMGEVKSDDQ